MSSTESIDFASFPVFTHNPGELLRDFATFCFSQALLDPLFANSSLDPSCEWESIMDEFYDNNHACFVDLEAARHQFNEDLCSAVKIRHRPVAGTTRMQAYLEVSTYADQASYELFIWVVKSCLEFSPFSLVNIRSQAVIHDSREGSSVTISSYTLADFE